MENDKVFQKACSQLEGLREYNPAKILQVLFTSLIPYLLLFYCSWLLYEINPWLTLILIFPLHMFHVRSFLVLHDCGHHSFIRQRWLNDLLGHITGFISLTPFELWREYHGRHHIYHGILEDRKLDGDLWILTVKEYHAASAWKKFVYRVYRHPITLLFISPTLLFFVLYRYPFRPTTLVPLINMMAMNVVLGVFVYLSIHFDFWQPLLIIYLPPALLSFTTGIFFFYIQHQFEDTVFTTGENYHFATVATQSASYFMVPKFYDWMTAYVGHHHVHHLDSLVPFYNLTKASSGFPSEIPVTKIHFRQAMKNLRLRLWDEEKQKMVPFS